MIPATADAWERLWSPYDESTYEAVLATICPTDVVLEIGAGDLRLARRLAGLAKQVIAWEIQADVLQRAKRPLPKNLVAYQVDALIEPIPPQVTTAVLLMRHCQHVRQYAHNLHKAGCHRLITNARCGLGVEVIDLQMPRLLYNALPIGWYACWCGATGFKTGRTEQLTPELETAVYEVVNCPSCS